MRTLGKYNCIIFVFIIDMLMIQNLFSIDSRNFIENMYSIELGDNSNSVYTSYIPISFFYKNSLSQTIYLENEIGTYGLITKLDFYMNLFGDINAQKPIKIWMGITEQNSFNDSEDWIDYSIFQLVFDGSLDFLGIGEQLLEINLQNPFVYTGGNLVIMTLRATDSSYYSPMNNFKATDISDESRTIQIFSDFISLNPVEPNEGILNNRIMNAIIHFNNNNLVTVVGFVRDSDLNNPVAEANVHLINQSRYVLTNVDGFYELPFVCPGDVSFKVTKYAYYDFFEGMIISADSLQTHDFCLEIRPLVTLSGTVLGSDRLDGLDSVEISLSGYNNIISTFSLDNGSYVFDEIYANTYYSLKMSKMNYETIIVDSIYIGLEDIILDEIIMQELINPPVSVFAVDRDDFVLLTWSLPSREDEDSDSFSLIYSFNRDSRAKSDLKIVTDTFNDYFGINNHKANRELNSFSVYRASLEFLDDEDYWELLATNVIDTLFIDYSWAGADVASYQYVVKAMYSDGNKSEPAYSNILEKNIYSSLFLKLKTEDNNAVEEAVLKLIDNKNQNSYQFTLSKEQTLLDSIRIGNYSVSVRMNNYRKFFKSNFVISEGFQELDIELEISDYILDDDFDIYHDFSSNLGDWNSIDGDNSYTYSFQGISFPNAGSQMSFIVFNPTQTIPPLELNAMSGQKMLAVFAAIYPPNNDWLISPSFIVGNNANLSFYAKSYNSDYGLERFKVLVGETVSPNSLIKISSGDYIEATVDWKKFDFSLGQFANKNIFIVIQCVSHDAFLFLLDDIKVTKGTTTISQDIVNPVSYKLYNNYPNPFNPETVIKFDNAQKGFVSLDIFNVKGQKVKSLVNRELDAGIYEFIWNGTDDDDNIVGSGFYFYRMKSGTYSSTKKMILLK